MAEKINFTKTALAKLTRDGTGQRLVVHDSTTPGLIAELRPGGKLSFYFYKWANGRPFKMRIGTFGEWTVEKARKRADAMRVELAQGNDPREARRAARSEWTFGQLWEHYLETYAKPRKRTWKEDEAQYNRYLKHWAGRRLSAIRKPDVVALHTKIGNDNGIYAANRMRSLLCKMFAVAADAGWKGDNPTRGVKKFKEQSRARFLQADELPRLFKAMEAEPSQRVRDFIVVSLLTGARRGNVLSMSWADIDLARGLWTIPAERSKNGEAMTLPLVPAVLDILKRRHEANGQSEYVFPGRHGTGHLQDPTRPWKAILARAGLTDVRLHDLRRTLASWAALMGTSLQVIGKTLGHKRAETTMVYSRLSLAPVQDCVSNATAAILAAAKPKQEAEGNGEA